MKSQKELRMGKERAKKIKIMNSLSLYIVSKYTGYLSKDVK